MARTHSSRGFGLPLGDLALSRQPSNPIALVLHWFRGAKRPAAAHSARPVKRLRSLSFELCESRELLDGASLSGIKFNTFNSSGFSASDVPQGGVFIDLFKDDGDKIFNAADTLVDRQQTASGTGVFTFSNVADGHYFIQEEVPNGYTQSAGPAFYTVDILGGVAYTGSALTIDDFTAPDPASVYLINASDPNPFLLQSTGSGIIGGQRDLLINVLGSANPISASGFVGAVNPGSNVFNLGSASSGPGTEVSLQYDGVDADTTALNDALALGADLTAGGANGFRLDFNFLQIGSGTTMDMKISLVGPSGTASYSANITENVGAFKVFVPYSSFSTTGSFSFANVSSLRYDFNAAGEQDVDFELDQIVAPQQKATGYNFGNHAQPASLAGFVYVDSNNNGIKENYELPISGVKVTLNGTDIFGQSVSQSTTTDSNGAYSFGDLRPGIYKLTEFQPINFVDGKDTIGTPGGTTSNDMFSNINLPAGFAGVNNNFGELGLTPTYVSKIYFLYPRHPANLTAVYDTSTTGSSAAAVTASPAVASPAVTSTSPTAKASVSTTAHLSVAAAHTVTTGGTSTKSVPSSRLFLRRGR
jgi:hypothetical protein